jgi:predicted Holliday junction resolvase-like endonuclease
MKVLIPIVWVLSAIAWLIAILIMIRALYLLKKVRVVCNQILANDKKMKENLPKVVAKSIARTVSIMNSKDEDAKKKLQQMISEE